MKIGITGATGLIGTAVGKLAGTRGHDVVAYTRDPTRCTLPWASEVRGMDVAADLPLDAAGVDVLVHLAGESILGLWTAAKMRRIRDSRVLLTQKIARCVESSHPGPSALLCGSGTGFYGDRGDEILTENSTAGKDFLASVCIDWEAAARADVRVVLLRTGFVLAPNGGAWPLIKKAFTLCAGGRLGNGRQWMPWIHVDDEAGLILWAAENGGLSGPLNLVSPGCVTNAVLTKTVAQTLKRPAIMHAPKFMLRLLLRGLADGITASQRAQPRVALDGGYVFQHPELASALRTL